MITSAVCDLGERNFYSLAPGITVIPAQPGIHCLIRGATTEGPRIAVSLEGVEAAPRTMTVPTIQPAEVIGRQLSDRERDPVFRESMAVAQVMAQSLLR